MSSQSGPGPAEREYDRWYQASIKFDYFLAGLAAAVFAYSVQSLDPEQFTRARWLAPVAWASLAISVLASLARGMSHLAALDSSVEQLLTTYKEDLSQEKKDRLADDIQVWLRWAKVAHVVALFGILIGFTCIAILKTVNW